MHLSCRIVHPLPRRHLIAGEPLPGVVPVLLADPITTTVSPKPQVIFYRPGVHSDVGLSIVSGTGPLTSGTPLLIALAENYSFYSGDKLATAPYVQDLVLFSYNRPELTAAFAVTPSLEFEALTLMEGVIDVDAYAPTDTERDLTIVGPAGGTVTTAGGESLTCPRGPYPTMCRWNWNRWHEDDLEFEWPDGLAYVSGIAVGFAGRRLALPASLSTPLPPGFVDQGQLLLVRLEAVQGVTRPVLVGKGEVQGDHLVAAYTFSSDPDVRLPGITDAGRFLFVQTADAVGFISGTVFDTAGSALEGAIVTTDSLPVVALSQSSGAYVAAAGVGPVSVTALDPIKMNSGTAGGSIPAADDLIYVDVALVEAPPQVVSFLPVDGQQNVPLGTAVSLTFSEPLDAATVTPANFILTGPAGPLPGTLSLTANNTRVTFRPADPLVTDRTYVFSVMTGVRDLAGYSLEEIFSFSFTTLDTTPPPLPPAGSINATIPGDDGRTTITATQGTAGVHDTVSVINKTDGTSTPVLVEADGSFSVNLDADILDEVVISIADPAGNEISVPIGRFRNPDGTVVIGPAGGLLEADNGVILDIPAGAFPAGAMVRLAALTEAEINVSPGPDFPFVAGFEFESSVAPQIYLNASAPLPAGTAADAHGIVAQVFDVYDRSMLYVVDTARVINGRLTTSSPPCPGIMSKFGRYAAFLNEHQEMALGAAILSMGTTPLPQGVSYEIHWQTDLLFTSFGFPAPFLLRQHLTEQGDTPDYALNDYLAMIQRTGVMSALQAAEEGWVEDQSGERRNLGTCLPVPADKPLTVTVRNIATHELLDIIEMGPMSPGSSATITYKDPRDETPPEVLAIKPVHKVLDAYGNRNVEIKFSEPVDPASMDTVTLVRQGENPWTYAGDWELRENNTLLIFSPGRLLPMGKNYLLDLAGVTDVNGNRFDGPPVRFTTFAPSLFCGNAMTRNSIVNDLAMVPNSAVTPEQIPTDLWFIDVDFSTRSPEKSADGKWHTDLVAIQGFEGDNLDYRLFRIDLTDPGDARVVSAFQTDARYLQHRLRFMDDVHITPRYECDATNNNCDGVPEFWNVRELHYRRDDPNIRICEPADSQKISLWRARYCVNDPDDPNDPNAVLDPDCPVITGGCGDLAVTTVDNTKYGYLWSFDMTDKEDPALVNRVRWISSRLLNDNGIGYGNSRRPEAPAGQGTPFGLFLQPGLDITHGTYLNEDTHGAYIANYGIGLELVDLDLNLPTINEAHRANPEYLFSSSENLGLNAHLYYRDVAMVRGKTVAIAGDISGNTGIRTLEIFSANLAGNPTGITGLLNQPNYLATAVDFPLFAQGAEEPTLHDLAFVTGHDGGISVVEIPPDGSSPARVNLILTPDGVVTKHIQVDRQARLAYVAALGVNAGQPGDHLLVVDMSSPFSSPMDADNDGWDDRIIGRLPIRLPGDDSPVYLQGFRLDQERGLIYAGIYVQTGQPADKQPLVVIKVRECSDLGIDFKQAQRNVIPEIVEKLALQKVIYQGLTQGAAACSVDLDGISMIEQGSGACLWQGQACGPGYQPGISDHDFEVFFPNDVLLEKRECVVKALYDQVITEQSDLIPVEVEGYRVTFDDISFYHMDREGFENAMLKLNPPTGEQGDVTGDMGLGRQLLLLKWLLEGAYVQVPGLELAGKDFAEIFAILKEKLDVDGDGTADEPSHISRLEGYEWAKLQDFNFYDSGALIRLKGADEPGTTLHHSFEKVLHKVGKAAIRAVMARIAADETGNAKALDFNYPDYRCIDVGQVANPLKWVSAECDSFAHYVASLAARMARDHAELGLFAPEEVVNMIYRFYRVKAGRDEITTEAEANTFISMAAKFIQAVGNPAGEAGDIYDETIALDPRKAERQANLAAALQRIESAKANGRRHIIPRVFNSGPLEIDSSIWARMYLDNQEEAARKVSPLPGAWLHVDTMKDPAPDNEDPNVLPIPQKNKSVFELQADQTDDSRSGWLSFVLNTREKNIQEPDRQNNWARVFYYVLDPDTPAVLPDPGEPELPVSDPDGDLLEPDLACGCAKPRILMTQSINGGDDVSLYIGTGNNCVDIRVYVENLSNQTVRKINVYNALVHETHTIDAILPGEKGVARFSYCAGNEPVTQPVVAVADYEDERGTVHFDSANTVYVNVLCPISLEPLDPSPNPPVSEVMYGGTFYRYYRLMDRSTGTPVANGTVDLTIATPSGPMPIQYKTHDDGSLYLSTETPDNQSLYAEGMCVPWELWNPFDSGPIEPTYPLTGKLEPQVPDEVCADSLMFDIAVKNFDYQESVKAGATMQDYTNTVFIEVKQDWFSGIDFTFLGHQEEAQTYDTLSLRRRNNTSKDSGEGGVKFGYTLWDLDAGVDLKLISLSFENFLETTARLYQGDRHHFPMNGLAMEERNKLSSISLFLYSLIKDGTPEEFNVYKKLRALGDQVVTDDILSYKKSGTYGMMYVPKFDLTLVEASLGLEKLGVPVSIDGSLGVGTGLGLTLEKEFVFENFDTGEAKLIKRENITGDVNISAAFDAKASWGDYASVTRQKIAELGGGMLHGIELEMILDRKRALLPEKLNVSILGKKDFGLKVMGNQVVDWGAGEQPKLVYSVTELDDIMKIAKQFGGYSALLGEVRRNDIGAVLPELRIGTEADDILLHLVDFLNLLEDNASYTLIEKKGRAVDFGAVKYGLKIPVVNIGSGGVSKSDADHALTFIKERGTLKGGAVYRLEDYSAVPEPTPQAMQWMRGEISALVMEQLQDVFEAVERYADEVAGKWGIKTKKSSDLQFNNPIDFEATNGPLSFAFEEIAGPLQPARYAPMHIVGAADKPHYGLGGFHEFLPVGFELSEPATLVLDYYDSEVDGLDESSLAIYQWIKEDKDWRFVGGILDAANNTITTEITQLGAYTIAPAMPAGTVIWQEPQVQQVGATIRLTLTSEPLTMNNGAAMAEGTVFHVSSVVPHMYAGDERVPFGTVLTEDARLDMEGSQITVAGGRVQVELEYPAGVTSAAAILIFSDIGTAFGDEIVPLRGP